MRDCVSVGRFMFLFGLTWYIVVDQQFALQWVQDHVRYPFCSVLNKN